MERDGLAALGELGIACRIVLVYVLAAACDGEHIEQLEIVGVHGVHERLGGALGVVELAPLLESLLRPARHAVDGGDAVLCQVLVVALGDDLYLVAQVEQTVVHGSCRQHEHLRADARLDDVLHQAVVAAFLGGVGRLVAEVVRLVDDDEVVVAPAKRLQVHVSRISGVARKVGVIEHREAQAVVCQHVALVVVRCVERPVLAQALGGEHEDASVSLLVVLHDGERLEGLSKTHAVGDDAALVLLQLVNGTDHGVLLEVVELVPDDRVLKPELRFYGVVLVISHKVPEKVIEGEEVDVLGSIVLIEGLDLLGYRIGHFLHHGGVVPHGIEHGLEASSLGLALIVAHTHHSLGSAVISETFQGEVGRCPHEGLRLAIRVVYVIGAARLDGTAMLGGLECRLLADPLRALHGKCALVEVVAQGKLKSRSAYALFARTALQLELHGLLGILHALDEGGLAEHEAKLFNFGKGILQLAVCEHREIRADDGELRIVADGLCQSVTESLLSDVAQELHR